MLRPFSFSMVAVGLALGCTPVEVNSSEPAKVAGRAEQVPTPVEVESAPKHMAPQGEGSLSIEVRPRFTHVRAGQSGTLDLLVRIQAVDVPGQERPPLDLALVLDRSGSMAGDKLAAAKQAALETFRELDGDDRITFISYDDVVTVHSRRVRVGQADAVKRAMMSLTDGGGTALGPALEQGLQILSGASRPEETVAHVMLLSDGLANEGESRPEVLAQWTSAAFAQGVAVSTLGVGLDYNEDLMTKLADAGGGRYHFIEKGDDVPQVLADEFSGLSSTVARNATLSVTPHDGLEVEQIPGYPNVREGVSTLVGIRGESSATGSSAHEAGPRDRRRRPCGTRGFLGRREDQR